MQQKIRLAILECDTPLPNTAKKYGGYGGVFKSLLYAGADAEGLNPETTLDISIFQIVDHPETYPNIDEIDAILLTGSKHDSFGDAPWIGKLVDFTAFVYKQKRIKIIGVCFGHQIIARALGVKVGRNADGWEAAVNEVELTPRGKEIFRLETLHIHQMHRDIVYSFPDGLESLGSSPVCSVQGMYKAGQIVTIQGHPEFNETIMREIIEARHKTGVFNEKAYQEYSGKVPLPHDGVVVSRAFIRFLLGE